MRPQVVHLRSHRTLRYAEGNVLSPPTLSPDTWYHQAASWNTDFATNEKVFQIYLNGANLGAVNNEDTTGGATPAQWSYYAPGYGGVTLVVPDLLNDGSYGPATTTTMADFQLWDGTFIDLSVPANLANFIQNGKPVDPAAAAAAFGQPTLLFSGGASTFGNNQGTGGAYNLAKPLFAHGRNGSGPISLPGAIAGQPVLSVIDLTNGAAGGNSGNFETTISVNNQIQQLSSADLSGSSFVFNVPGTLSDASTSPSN